VRALIASLLTACALACGVVRHDVVDDLVPDAGHRTADGGRPTSASSDAAAAAEPADAAPHVAARCGKQACACDNGLDDDGDGLLDGLDPECTAAFDDDEASFATGLPNKLGGCRDCFWDDNAGNGDDDCRYPAECLTGAAPNGNGSCSSCTVSAKCIDSCAARTPNGCDCFGCCEVARETGERVFIQLVADCQLARLDDLTSCPRCVQNTTCANGCGRCELCLGKTESALPADCKTDTGSRNYSCEDGLRTCGSSADCRSSEYCQLGCCLVDLL
jgi:hypothetical protein